MRESLITRTTGLAFKRPDPRDIGQDRFWSAMVMSNEGSTIAPSSYGRLKTNAPRHATNGETDFDTAVYPSISLIVPYDGIYGISAAATFELPDPEVAGATLYVQTGSEQITLDTIDFSPWKYGVVRGHRVGYPLSAGMRIWLGGYNGSNQSMWCNVEHLEATYFCPLGTLWPIKGGPS